MFRLGKHKESRSKKKKEVTRHGIIMAVVLVCVSVMLFFLAMWAFKTWTGLTMDEIIFHLNAPLEGTGDGIIESGFLHTLIPMLIALGVEIFIVVKFRSKENFHKFLTAEKIASFALIIFTLVFAWNKLALGSYISSQINVSTFVEDNYTDPADTKITFPEKKRNLIYIYLESMENTYADEANGGAFSQNVIPELTKLSEENENFSGSDNKLNGGLVMPGGTYTMAAMFSQSTGLPMNVSLGEDFTDTRGSFNNMDTQSSFFPGVTSIGDILEDEGYNNVLMLGSDATFGGRKLFYSTHGDYEIDDYNWAIDQGLISEDYYVFWGYEDQKLFSYAKDRLTQLASSDEPFNFTMLTVDTHFEDGYVCDLCEDEFGLNQYANVMACSSRQVAEFVEWIQQQDFYENTTIVISGDHTTMDSDFCSDVSDDYQRKVYTTYINAAAQPETDTEREYTTLDNFPTTLAALGCTIEGNRLGLGTNLFSSEKTIVEEYGYDYVYKELGKRSEFIENLAQIDVYDEDLMKKKGLLPKASLTVTEFDESKEEMTACVQDIENVYSSIDGVTVKLEDSSGNNTSTEFEKGDEDGSWVGTLSLDGIDYTDATMTATVTTKDGNSYDVATVLGDMSLKTTSFPEFLGRLNDEDKDNYCILVAVKDDASRIFSLVMDNGMKTLGFKKSLMNHFRYSYYGVLTPDGLQAEEIGIDELSTSGTLPDGASYSIISQGGNSGAGGAAGRYLTCSIKINGVEYAPKRIGLNFVIYDLDTHQVVDSVCYNTNDKLTCTRADLASIKEDAEKESESETQSDSEAQSESEAQSQQ